VAIEVHPLDPLSSVADDHAWVKAPVSPMTSTHYSCNAEKKQEAVNDEGVCILNQWLK
jgi:hypothetical protein